MHEAFEKLALEAMQQAWPCRTQLANIILAVAATKHRAPILRRAVAPTNRGCRVRVSPSVIP
jgi:hypothetical protein